MNNRKDLQSHVLFLMGSIPLFIFFVLLNNVQLIIWFLLLFTIVNCLLFFRSLEKHILIFLFIITFSLFDLGTFYSHLIDTGEWWKHIEGSMIEYSLDTDAVILTLIVYFCSLFLIIIGYMISLKFKIKINTKSYFEMVSMHPEKMNLFRKHITFLYWIALPFGIIHYLNTFLSVFNNSYVYLYLGYSEIWIFRVASLICSSAFYCFLATFPRRKKARPVIISYVILLFVSVLSGQRAYFMSGLFFLLYYYFVRADVHEIDKEIKGWISKKVIGILAIFSPVFFALLSMISVFRNKDAVDHGLMFYSYRFLYSQGESGVLLTKAIEISDDLRMENVNFTFGRILRIFQNNENLCDLFNLKYLGAGVHTQSKLNAIYGNNFGAAISFHEMPYLFLRGLNLGSNYLAEIWMDYGWRGIIFFNVIIGFLLGKIANIRNRNFIEIAVFFGMINQFLMIGRYSLSSVFTFFTSSAVILTYGIFVFEYLYLFRKGKEV